MLELPQIELVLFILVISLYLTAAIVGIVQISAGGVRYKPVLTHLIGLAVLLEAVILIFRAIAIKGVPLTGLFESMIVLSMSLGAIYLILGMVIRQVWFGSVMAWCILLMTVLTAIIAQPASEPHAIAAMPWAIAHGMAMIFGLAMILLAAVAAYLYLLGRRRLKQKQTSQLIGSVPNIQKLERLNLFGLKTSFIFITIGLISGIGGLWWGSEMLGKSPAHMIFDPKIIAITISWLILGLVLIAYRLHLLQGKNIAYVTILIFSLVLFAFIAGTIIFKSRHNFAITNPPRQTQLRELQ